MKDVVHAGSESQELVHVIGGQFVTRQGMRAHWSAENTTMHLIRACYGLVYIDEQEMVSLSTRLSPARRLQ